MTQPEARQTPLFDLLDQVPEDIVLGISGDEPVFQSYTNIPIGKLAQQAAAELRRLHALVAACEPYLKEGETPAERIERDHKDSLALMSLLAREKEKNEALLEALKVVIDDLMYQNHARVIDVARAAIAKAEGEKV